MCDQLIKVTKGIGSGGVFRCRCDHQPNPQSVEPVEMHEVYLGWGGATICWDDTGWQWPSKPQAEFEVLKERPNG
jgi:hypothetical protein